MKIYYDGRYFNEQCSEADRAYLKANYPFGYNKLFINEIKPTFKAIKGTSIYQIYYDDNSSKGLDSGFIPYFTKSTPHNFENDVIIDIWRRRDWINSKYVGILSWRFFEKTALSSGKLKLSGDINYFYIPQFKKYEHPYSRKGFVSVNKMVDVADEHCLFPFKLRNKKINTIVWCNYFAVTPQVFDHYCTDYLSKAIEFFKNRPEYALTERHRGKDYFAFTFFLEGLFSIFVTENPKYKIKRHGI